MSWSPDTDALRGRVAVVAGATRGAGRGIAVALGEAGATVICTGRSTRSHLVVNSPGGLLVEVTDDTSTIRNQPVITHQAALEVLAAAIAEGAKLGVAVSVTVVDSGTNLVAFAKAVTVRRRTVPRLAGARPTPLPRPGERPGGCRRELAVSLPLGTGNLLTNLLGGVPLSYAGQLGGGLGIAGGLSGALASDMAFRPALTALRQAWGDRHGLAARALPSVACSVSASSPVT